MNRLRLILIAVLAFIAAAAIVSPAQAQVSLPYTTDLIIDGRGEALDIGDVTMNAYSMLTFTIDEAGTDWRLETTRVYVGDKPPVKIKTDNFPYTHEGLGGAIEDVFYLDLRAADLDGDGIVYIAAYAELVPQNIVTFKGKSPRLTTETAVALGEQLSGKGKNKIDYFSLAISG